jgi:hypothetical protein
MGSRNFIPIAVLIAACFWAAESLFHYYYYGGEIFEVIPADINEFIMRTLIVFLVIGFGIYIDYATTKREDAVDKGKRKYMTAVKETRKKFSDFLNKAEDFELEARKSRGMDKDILAGFMDSIKEARGHLEDVGDITMENIRVAIKGPARFKIPEEVRQCATECTKEHACLMNEKHELCPVVKNIEGKIHFIQCIEERPCKYKNHIGDSIYTCTCPVRKDIFNKYGV